ncbi:MAG: hypothetical protein WEA80_04475 [Gemmatimonadaceae bacterium]
MTKPKHTGHREADAHELAYFIRVANESGAEAEAELEEPLSFLSNIDRLYVDFFGEAGGIRPPTAGILLLNAHASLRAAIRLALSGQLLPVYMVLRGSIESALYAHAMVVNPELQDVWLNRGKDGESRQACRNAFTVAKVFRYLEQAHEKEFSDGLRDVYEATIDFGAHPNSQSIISSVRIEELTSGSHALDFAYIHGVGSFELRQALVACAESALAGFFVALLSFKNHPRLVMLNELALELQGRVPSFIEGLELDAPTNEKVKPRVQI